MNFDIATPSPTRCLTTVMLVELSGFTPILEQEEPGEASGIMSRCLSMMERIIQKNGGIIDKRSRNRFMAKFDMAAVESTGCQAVQTAIELQNGLAVFNKKNRFGAMLEIQAGINTGNKLAGVMGDDHQWDTLLMVDTVDVASQLERISNPGQVLVGPETYRTARGKFHFKKVKPLVLKGKAELLPIYELLPYKRSYRIHNLISQRMISSELVGRDTEIAMVTSCFQKLYLGKGGIVNLAGEAGIGKSRILLEVKKNKVCRKFSFMEGRCIPIGRKFGFHSFSNLFQDWAGIHKNEKATISFQKLWKAVHLILDADTDETVFYIAKLIGLNIPPNVSDKWESAEGNALAAIIANNIQKLLAKISLKKPLVFVMEDLQWSDSSSAELLSALFPLSKEYPILFVNLFRPFTEMNIHRLFDIAGSDFPEQYVEIPVQPLSQSDGEFLIDNLVKNNGMPQKVKSRILQRAEGNPFFIEEIIRLFIDIGAVVIRNGRYAITNMIDMVTIPQTGNDIVNSRIDRLDDTAREVLRIASVIGRTFCYRILSEVAGSLQKIDSSLKELKELQLIVERHRYEETEYAFKHALLQEAVYVSIPYPKRRELHRKIAGAIEVTSRKRADESYGILAHHYAESDNANLAEKYLLKAGAVYLQSGASNEALHCFQEALAIYMKTRQERIDLYKIAMIEKNIALSLTNRGQYKDALTYYKKALARFQIPIPEKKLSGSPYFVFMLLDLLTSLYLPILAWRKDPDNNEMEMIDLINGRVSTVLYTDLKQFSIEAFFFSRHLSRYNILKMEGGAGLIAGLSAAFTWSAVSLRLSRKMAGFAKQMLLPGDRKSKANIDVADLLLGYYAGNWKMPYNADLIACGLEQGTFVQISVYIALWGNIRLEQGKYDEARLLVKQLSGIGRTYSQNFTIALKYFLNTKLLLKYRKLTEALVEAEEGIAFAIRNDFKQILMVLYSLKAMIRLFSNEAAAAQDALHAADQIRQATEIIFSCRLYYELADAYCGLYGLGDVLQKKNRKTIAISRKKAWAACRRLQKRTSKVTAYQTEVNRLMGIYYRLTGDERKALRCWHQSVAVGTRLDARLELSRTYYEIGGFFQDRNTDKTTGSEKADREDYLGKAGKLFREMGLRVDSEKIIFSPHKDA